MKIWYTDEKIADECNADVFREDIMTGKIRVAVGNIKGIRCSARWGRNGELAETVMYATHDDVKRLLADAAQELIVYDGDPWL